MRSTSLRGLAARAYADVVARPHVASLRDKRIDRKRAR